jgi:signal peptidase I
MNSLTTDINMNSETADDTTPAAAPPATPTPPVEKQGWGAALWAEIKGLFWLLLAVLGFHSFIAKPFYIPSISMMPNLLVGDRLFVSKYAYGWSHVSPTIPNPVAIFRGLILRENVDSYAFTMPESKGRIWGKMPERGDIVILTPEGMKQDWIKRVIGLPGDTIAVKDGQVIINGVPVKQEVQPNIILPADAQICDGTPCNSAFAKYAFRTKSGKTAFALPTIRETLPNGVSYNILDTYQSAPDNMEQVKVPAGHVFLMGDNRDHSSDSRVSGFSGGLGGPVSWDRLGGRAEIVTFSVDGSTDWNPATWFSSLRGDRAGNSLRPERIPAGKAKAE